MARTERHHGEDFVNEVTRYLFIMKQIREAVHEHPARLLPVQRPLQPLGMTADLPERTAAPKPMGDGLRVTVPAAFAHLLAAAHGIPRLVGPFNF